MNAVIIKATRTNGEIDFFSSSSRELLADMVDGYMRSIPDTYTEVWVMIGEVTANLKSRTITFKMTGEFKNEEFEVVEEGAPE